MIVFPANLLSIYSNETQPFSIREDLKRYPFRAEPSRIVHHMEHPYPLPPPPPGTDL